MSYSFSHFFFCWLFPAFRCAKTRLTFKCKVPHLPKEIIRKEWWILLKSSTIWLLRSIQLLAISAAEDPNGSWPLFCCSPVPLPLAASAWSGGTAEEVGIIKFSMVLKHKTLIFRKAKAKERSSKTQMSWGIWWLWGFWGGRWRRKLKAQKEEKA
jgi:hypothetical protein